MPIEGHYQPKHPAPSAPYVRAIVELPRLNIWDFVHFLADTGADNTTMHPDDVSNLRIDFTRLNRPTPEAAGSAVNWTTILNRQTSTSWTENTSSQCR